MNIFGALDSQDFGELHLCHDKDSQLSAIIAINDTTLGPALGGCRFVEYPSDEAAITDALRLARGMTRKAAISGLALGGGKSVIIKPKGEFDRERLFARFGQFIETLNGRYITAEDSGTKVGDMETIRARTKHVTGVPVAMGGSGDPSPYTALGVRRGVQAMVKSALGRDDMEGLHVAVQGVGNVGYHLCKELHELGATLTVADIDSAKVERARDNFGAKTSSLTDIFATDCDIFAPCALGGAINDDTINQLRCQIVAGAANNQLATQAHGQQLFDKGIAYAPDYAINAGGLMNVYQETQGWDRDAAMKNIDRVYDIILDVAERAKHEKKPANVVANAIADERVVVASR